MALRGVHKTHKSILSSIKVFVLAVNVCNIERTQLNYMKTTEVKLQTRTVHAEEVLTSFFDQIFFPLK